MEQWRSEHPGYGRGREKNYLQTPKGKFSRYRRDARIKGFIFDLTLDEFSEIISEPCYYCGGDGFGIDRWDNSIGYIKGNMVSCCSMCNFMKKTYTEDEFVNQYIKIIKNLKGDKEQNI